MGADKEDRFAINGDDEDVDLPSEFKLLVEEQGILECIAGNTNWKFNGGWRPSGSQSSCSTLQQIPLQKLQKEAAEAFCGIGDRTKKMPKLTGRIETLTKEL